MSDTYRIIIEIIIFPILAIGLWTLIFNSKNSWFTRILVEGGYLLVVIPLLVLTFISIPAMGLLFYASANDIDTQITTALVGGIIGISLIIEYFYIKRIVKSVEEKEQMSIWKVLRRELKKETHEVRKQEKKITKEKAKDYFSEIDEMNKKRRDLDLEEKEKLRKALLGEVDSPVATNPPQSNPES